LGFGRAPQYPTIYALPSYDRPRRRDKWLICFIYTFEKLGFININPATNTFKAGRESILIAVKYKVTNAAGGKCWVPVAKLPNSENITFCLFFCIVHSASQFLGLLPLIVKVSSILLHEN